MCRPIARKTQLKNGLLQIGMLCITIIGTAMRLAPACSNYTRASNTRRSKQWLHFFEKIHISPRPPPQPLQSEDSAPQHPNKNSPASSWKRRPTIALYSTECPIFKTISQITCKTTAATCPGSNFQALIASTTSVCHICVRGTAVNSRGVPVTVSTRQC